MESEELYAKILGLNGSWKVADLRLDEESGVVKVELDCNGHNEARLAGGHLHVK
jgi:hypothetical protein